MNRSSTKALCASTLSLGLVVVGCSVVAGCVVEPDQRHYADGLVMVAPPPPRVEMIGDPPESGFVWIAGYWNWVGGRHVWVAGHWQPGRAGYHWVAHAWVRQGDGWRLKPGHWQRG